MLFGAPDLILNAWKCDCSDGLRPKVHFGKIEVKSQDRVYTAEKLNAYRDQFMQMIEPEMQELIASSRSNKHFKSESLKGNVSDDEENIKISTKMSYGKTQILGPPFGIKLKYWDKNF